MFHVPEKYRFTKEISKAFPHFGPDKLQALVGDSDLGNNGYFYLPRMGLNKQGRPNTGYHFLCKATQESGWNVLAVFIPSESGRPATWDELLHIRKFFWDEADIVQMVMLGDKEFLYDRGWLHLWQAQEGTPVTYPPYGGTPPHFELEPSWMRFLKRIKRKLNGKRSNKLSS